MVKKSRTKRPRTKRPRTKRPRTKRPRTKRKMRKNFKNGGSSGSQSNSFSSWDMVSECYDNPNHRNILMLSQRNSIDDMSNDIDSDLFESASSHGLRSNSPRVCSPSSRETVVPDHHARNVERIEIIDQLETNGYRREAQLARQDENSYAVVMVNYGKTIMNKAAALVSGAVSQLSQQFGISPEDVARYSREIKIQTLYIYIDNYTRGSTTGVMRGTEARARAFAHTIGEISRYFTTRENAEYVERARAGLSFMEYINDWWADIKNWRYIQNYFLQAIGEVIANGMKATPQAIRNWNSLCSILSGCENYQEGMGGFAPPQRVLDAAVAGRDALQGALGGLPRVPAIADRTSSRSDP